MYLKVYFIILERNKNYFVVLKNTARKTVRKMIMLEESLQEICNLLIIWRYNFLDWSLVLQLNLLRKGLFRTVQEWVK